MPQLSHSLAGDMAYFVGDILEFLSDSDLNRNATKYRDNHIHKDAAEIILHFINGKYRNMLTTINGNKPARAMVAYL